MSLMKLFVKTAYAANGGSTSNLDDSKFKLPDPFKFGAENSLWTVVGNIINLVLIVVGLVAFGYLLYGGVLFVTSGGDSDKVTNARNTIMYAIIGIVVVVLSYAIFNWARGLID